MAFLPWTFPAFFSVAAETVALKVRIDLCAVSEFDDKHPSLLATLSLNYARTYAKSIADLV